MYGYVLFISAFYWSWELWASGYHIITNVMLVCKSLRLNMHSFLKGTFPSAMYVDSSVCY